jgi:C4-dicarboxylate transporter DctM subunit
MAGTVLESLPNTIILALILVPIAYTLGEDPIHIAVTFTVNPIVNGVLPQSIDSLMKITQ